MLRFKSKKLILICIIINSFCYSQTRQDLEKEKLKIEKEIEATNDQIKQQEKKKNSALNDLEISNTKIDQQNQLLVNLESCIIIHDVNIQKIQDNIKIIQNNIYQKEQILKLLKESYAKILYKTYIWRNTYNETYFLISSSDLNQLYKRKKYLKQMRLDRYSKINEIQKTKQNLLLEKENLIIKESELIQEKNLQEDLLAEKINQKEKLEKEKTRNEKIVHNIKKNQEFYKQLLTKKIQESKKIEAEIRRVIEEEIRMTNENRKKNNSDMPFTPEILELSSNFEKNKGKLPWPLKKGIIIQYYGKQKHEVIPGVETVNNGINFKTEEGAICRSVFNGKVSRIFVVKGNGKAILINHGNYYTVYSGLKDVLVKNGEQVVRKQKLGTIITKDGDTELHFEIWKGTTTENPVKWLYQSY